MVFGTRHSLDYLLTIAAFMFIFAITAFAHAQPTLSSFAHEELVQCQVALLDQRYATR